jgi:lipoprotein-anchoring transpeptidase ErfK/SrfK
MIGSSAQAAAGELGAGDLGWPSSTTAATVKRRIPVLEQPRSGDHIASIAAGTYVTWTKIVKTPDACGAWVQLHPRGWACATDLAPAGAPPTAPAAPSTGKFAELRGAASAYADLAAIRAAQPNKRVDANTRVALRGSTLGVNGTHYVLTDVGWIAADKLSTKFEPGVWTGIDLQAAPLALDFGWAVSRVPGQKIAVRDAAHAKGRVVRELSPRDLVTIQKTQAGFAQIGENEWVDAVEIRHVVRAPRPDGIGDRERWLDVDIQHQTLIAYEGDTPKFVTLISTGKFDFWGTPTGIHRIVTKEPVANMASPRDMGLMPDGTPRETWDVSNVPYVMFYRRNFALHGAYWHDGFGRARSHGCINLSPPDAQRVYEFASPVAPKGWSSVRTNDDDGTPVRIRASWDPNPKWLDYNGFPLQKRDGAYVTNKWRPAAPKPAPAPTVTPAPAPAPPPPATPTAATEPPKKSSLYISGPPSPE